MTTGARRCFAPLALAALGAATGGCVIPVVVPVTPFAVPARLQPAFDADAVGAPLLPADVTTREAVLLRLGDPELVLDADRTFVYVGTVVSYLVVPGNVRTADYGASMALTVRFDDDGRVLAARLVRGGMFTDGCDLAREAGAP